MTSDHSTTPLPDEPLMAQPPLCLSAVEARVIGALIEKELTTPEYYPLTLNSLLAACNQKNNRYPVMTLEVPETQSTIHSLQDKRMIESFSGATARAVKYRERFLTTFKLDPAERAVMCELLLRGAQTVGELKNRAARMHPFASLDEVVAALQRLATHERQALVNELPRQPGQKETRFVQLLSHEVPIDNVLTEPDDEAGNNKSHAIGTTHKETLEARVTELENVLAVLQTQFMEFKTQFE